MGSVDVEILWDGDGVNPLPQCGQTLPSINNTFPRTSYSGGKNAVTTLVHGDCFITGLVPEVEYTGVFK